MKTITIFTYLNINIYNSTIMKQLLILWLIFLIPYNINAQHTAKDDLLNKCIAKIDSLEIATSQTSQRYSIKNDSLLKELSLVKEKYDYIINLNTQTTNSISNQLNAVPISLSIFGVLFAVAAVILGVYVTRIENKVSILKEDTQKLLNETINTRDEVRGINELIHKDIKGLYEKIKREETVHILDRLINVPYDIVNLLDSLLSRKLEKEDYQKLKTAYLKLDEKDRILSPDDIFSVTNYGNKYFLIFFQHFLDLLTIDPEIGKDAIIFYPTAIKCAFKNDIEQMTKALISIVSNKELEVFKDEFSSFMKELSLSKHKDNKVVYKIIFNNLHNKEKQFKFFDIIKKNKEVRFALIQYGELLENKYKDEDLNDFETSIFEYLTQIKEEFNQRGKKES